jgi:hypothetical protein
MNFVGFSARICGIRDAPLGRSALNAGSSCTFLYGSCKLSATSSRGRNKKLAANFKSLKVIVHFYNTRDVLPRCKPDDPGEGLTCWPAPESTANMNTSKVGRLGLSDSEEDAIVSFMQTLSDGYMPAKQQ